MWTDRYNFFGLHRRSEIVLLTWAITAWWPSCILLVCPSCVGRNWVHGLIKGIALFAYLGRLCRSLSQWAAGISLQHRGCRRLPYESSVTEIVHSVHRAINISLQLLQAYKKEGQPDYILVFLLFWLTEQSMQFARVLLEATLSSDERVILFPSSASLDSCRYS